MLHLLPDMSSRSIGVACLPRTADSRVVAERLNAYLAATGSHGEFRLHGDDLSYKLPHHAQWDWWTHFKLLRRALQAVFGKVGFVFPWGDNKKCYITASGRPYIVELVLP